MRIEHIEEILDDLGGGAYRRSGTHLMSVCPMSPWSHGSGRERRAESFGVLISEESPTPCHCFNADCPATGTLYQLIEKVGQKKMADGEEGWDARRILELQMYMLEMEEEELGDEDRVQVEVLPIPDPLMEALGSGSAFWRGRGVDEKTMREWMLFEQGGRAFIPILDRFGDVVGMQGRLMPDFEEDEFSFDLEAGVVPQANKYRTFPPRFQRANYVAGEHLCPSSKSVDLLVVVEGIADAPLLNAWLREWWEDGRHEVFPYGSETQGFLAVATMGADWSEPQVQKILDMLSSRGELVLGFDRDKGGIGGTMKFTRLHWKRFPSLSIVDWRRTDPSNNPGDEPVALVQEDAFQDLSQRKSWLLRSLEKKLRDRS